MRPAQSSMIPQQQRLATAVGLFLLLYALFLLTSSRILHVQTDEGIVFATIENIVKYARFDIEQLASVPRAVPWEFGADGRHYSKYGIIQPLLAMPLYWVALHRPDLGMVDTVLLFNSVVTALTAAVLFLIAQKLGYDAASSLVLGILWALGTFAWPYAKLFYGDPLSTLLLVLAAHFSINFAGSRQKRQAVLAGLFSGFALGVKLSNAVVVPAFLAFIAYSAREGGIRKWIRAGTFPTVAFLVPVFFFIALVGLYNSLRFGNPLQTGYGPHEQFSTPLLSGLSGLLFSPGKSLFLYSPILILSLLALGPFMRRHGAIAWLFLGVVVLQILLYAQWWMWWGGGSWGPRLLLPASPFLALTLLPMIRDAWQWKASPIRLSFWLLLALSIAVQMLALSVDETRYLGDQAQLDPALNTITITDIRYSQMLNQTKYWQLPNLNFGWVFGNAETAEVRIAPEVLGPMVFLVLLALCSLALVVRRRGPGHARSQLLPLGVLSLCGLLALGTTYYSLRAYFLNSDEAYRAIGQDLLDDSDDTVAVVFSDFARQSSFLNANRSRIYVVGLGEERPLSESTQRKVEEVLARAGASGLAEPELVHITPTPPGEAINGIELELEQRTYSLARSWYGNTRLNRYVVPRLSAEGSLRKTSQASLGNSIELSGYELAWITGRVLDRDRPTVRVEKPSSRLYLTLHWRAKERVTRGYTVFLQLIDAEGRLRAQRDELPLGGMMPTNRWQAGEVVEDRYALPLPGTLAPASYLLIAGMYDLSTGERLRVSRVEGEVLDYIPLATLLLE